ncbi:hypothetical protein A1O3_05851 [Capronia epimyces CBS 606.96]|uniref:Uncharacterized protein n=1 Tax=Capronia epimyces CBS 606.96 TaxID=1182542 RepID=W9Y7E9_9EURO|nr:uncharacterized protein A1O3_05851 [Capronia epimyces CBS 606.96]EXJ85176.1 hypothetical protein A1O3_05851 [Capronia epimyces CBS 606.96]
MAHAAVNYTGLGRWFRQPPPQPNMPAPLENLSTNLSNSFYRLPGQEVEVQCWHEQSEWGQTEKVASWTPHLYIIFNQAQKPRWAKFTVQVRPQAAPADPTADFPPPRLTSHYIFPSQLLGGVRRVDTRNQGGTLNPSAAGVSVLGLTLADTHTYGNAIKARWEVEGDTGQCDDSFSHRQAQWRLKAAKPWQEIPKKLRMGLIVTHEDIFPFRFAVKIEGALHTWLLGDYCFSAQSQDFVVNGGNPPDGYTVDNFKQWEEKMKDWTPVLGLEIVELPRM